MKQHLDQDSMGIILLQNFLTEFFPGEVGLNKRLHVCFNNWFMLSVRISSYGCTREVWRAREKRKSCSRRSQERL